MNRDAVVADGAIIVHDTITSLHQERVGDVVVADGCRTLLDERRCLRRKTLLSTSIPGLAHLFGRLAPVVARV